MSAISQDTTAEELLSKLQASRDNLLSTASAESGLETIQRHDPAPVPLSAYEMEVLEIRDRVVRGSDDGIPDLEAMDRLRDMRGGELPRVLENFYDQGMRYLSNRGKPPTKLSKEEKAKLRAELDEQFPSSMTTPAEKISGNTTVTDVRLPNRPADPERESVEGVGVDTLPNDITAENEDVAVDIPSLATSPPKQALGADPRQRQATAIPESSVGSPTPPPDTLDEIKQGGEQMDSNVQPLPPIQQGGQPQNIAQAGVPPQEHYPAEDNFLDIPEIPLRSKTPLPETHSAQTAVAQMRSEKVPLSAVIERAALHRANLSTDPTGTLARDTREAMDADIAQLSQKLSNLPGDGQRPLELQQDLIAGLQRSRSEQEMVIAYPFIAAARGTLGPSASTDMVYRVAANSMILKMIENVDDGQGFLEQGLNLASWLVWDTSLIDSAGSDNPFNIDNIEAWHALDGLDKLALLPSILDAAVSYGGVGGSNPEKAQELLRRLAVTGDGSSLKGEAYWQNFFSGFDTTLNVVGITSAATKLVKLGRLALLIKKTNNPVTVMVKDINARIEAGLLVPEDEIRLVAELIAEGIDPAVADVLGTTAQSLISTATPFNLEKLDPAATSFVHGSSVVNKLDGTDVDTYMAVRNKMSVSAGEAADLANPGRIDAQKYAASYNAWVIENTEELKKLIPKGMNARIEPVVTEDGRLALRVIDNDAPPSPKEVPSTKEVPSPKEVPSTKESPPKRLGVTPVKDEKSEISVRRSVEGLLGGTEGKTLSIKEMGELLRTSDLSDDEIVGIFAWLRQWSSVQGLDLTKAGVSPKQIDRALKVFLEKHRGGGAYKTSADEMWELKASGWPKLSPVDEVPESGKVVTRTGKEKLVLMREVELALKEYDPLDVGIMNLTRILMEKGLTKEEMLEVATGAKSAKDTPDTIDLDAWLQAGPILDSLRRVLNKKRPADKKRPVDEVPEAAQAGEEGGVVQEIIYTTKVDDFTGVQEILPVNKLEGFLSTPVRVFERRKETKVVFDTAMRILNAKAGLANKFAKTFAAGEKRLREGVGLMKYKKAQQTVSAFLEQGSKEGKVYSKVEMMDGVEIDGEIFRISSQAEFDYYLHARGMADSLWSIQNGMGIQDALLAGKKRLTSLSNADIPLIGIPKQGAELEGYVRALRSEFEKIEGTPMPKVWDSRLEKFISFDDVVIEAERGTERVFLDLSKDRPAFLSGSKYKELRGTDGSTAEYVMVHVDELEDLHQGMFLKPFASGYMPFDNIGAEFAVKLVKPGIVNGTLVDDGIQELAQLFTTKAQAEAYIASKPEQTFKLLEDFENKSGTGSLESSFQAAGDRGKRSDNIIKLDLQDITHESVTTSLERHMQSLSEHVPIEAWRRQLETQFIKSINDDGRFVPIKDILDPLVIPDNVPGKLKLERGAEFMRDYIRTVTLTPIKEERMFASTLRRVAVAIEGDSTSRVRQAAARTSNYISHSDPITALKGITFSTYMGFFNLGQLFVQSQAASVAIGIHSGKAVANLPRTIAIMAAYRSDNDDAIRLLFKAFPNEPGLKDDLDFIRRTGILDSLLNVGEHNASRNASPLSKHKILRYINDNILMKPYTIGEGFSRTLALFVARDVWRAKNKGKALTKEGEEWIIAEQQRLTLQMLEPNKARFQTGTVGLTTQFWQVVAKMYEAVAPVVLGGRVGFTPAEKAKLLITQAIFYGPAGLTFGNVIFETVANILGIDVTELPEPVKDMISGGLADAIFGGDISLATRGGILSSFEDTLLTFIGDRDKDAWEMALGASGGFINKQYVAWNILKTVWQGTTGTETLLAMAPVTLEFLRSIKSIDSAMIASHMLRREAYLTSRGIEVPHQFTTKEIMFQFMGIRPTTLGDINNAVFADKELKLYEEALSNKILQGMNALIQHQKNDEPFPIDTVAFIQGNMPVDANDIQAMRIYNMVMNKLKSKSGAEAVLFRKILKQESMLFVDDWLGIGLVDKLSTDSLRKRLLDSREEK